MPPRGRRRLTQAEKRAAAEQLAACKDAEADFAVVAAGGALAAAIGEQLPVYALSMAFLAALLRRHTRKVERTVEDPPRADFDVSTERRMLHLDPGRALGDSPIENATRKAADPRREANASLSAFVRALERAQGADEANERRALEARTREAEEFALRFARDADAANTALKVFADEFWAASPSFSDRTWTVLWFESSRPGRLNEVLAPEITGRLRAAGVTESELAINLSQRPTLQSFAAAGGSALRVGESLARLAAEIAGR